MTGVSVRAGRGPAARMLLRSVERINLQRPIEVLKYDD
jgi:hypothetical protein